MFSYKLTLALNTFLTIAFILIINTISENPSPANLAILTLTTVMQTILFFGDKK